MVERHTRSLTLGVRAALVGVRGWAGMMLRMGMVLDYAPRQVWWRRRRVRRAVGVAVLVILLGVGVWWAWGPVNRRARVLYWQRECMRWEWPRGTVVWERGKGAGAPGCFVELAKMLKALGGEVPYEDVVFVHGRRSIAGERLVVAVFIPVGGTGPALVVRLVKPGGVAQNPAVMRWQWQDLPGALAEFLITPEQAMDEVGIPKREARRVRVFAAELDGRNEAKFVLPVEVDGVRYVIEGTLNARGDDVGFVVRGPDGGVVK